MSYTIAPQIVIETHPMISLHIHLLSYVQGSRAGMFLTFLSFCFRNDDTPFLYLHMEHSDRHGWEDVVNRRDDRDSISMVRTGQGIIEDMLIFIGIRTFIPSFKALAWLID